MVEEEIFVAFWPLVNSMPLVEWFALKQEETGWKLMEMYHQDDDMAQNAFPISVFLKEKDFVFSRICEGCDKEIIYDATSHYEKKKKDKEELNDNTYDTYVGCNFEVGDIVGTTSAWGIWSRKM